MSRPIPPPPPPPPPPPVQPERSSVPSEVWTRPGSEGMPVPPPPPPVHAPAVPNAFDQSATAYTSSVHWPDASPAGAAAGLGSQVSLGGSTSQLRLGATVRPPRTAAIGHVSSLPGQAGAEPDAALRSRLHMMKLRRRRRWAWLTQLPGYDLLESLWMRFSQVRDAGVESSQEERKRELPAWLVSFIVHVVLLLILALIPLAGLATSKLQMIVGDFNGEGGIEFTLTPEGSDISLQEVDAPLSNFATDLPEMDLTVPSITPSLSPAKSSEELGANLAGMAVEQGLAGRSGSLKGALLAKFGGNSSTEAAVNAGLKWLAYQQQPDGGWSLIKHYSDAATNEDRTAATAMALNAFLGAGHTHKSGEYKELVDRGLKFLLKKQDKEGFFANGEPSHNQMYSQAIATITVCEAYGLTGDSNLKMAAGRAIKFAEWSQGKQKGWRYEPREDSDLSVTGWYMMALMTGKMAGLEPSEKVIKSVGDYLDSVEHDYGARYAYQRPEPASLSMTAEGLLCRQYLGWPSSHPALQRAIELDLLPNSPEVDAPIISVYYWYYATQVLHHVGGNAWTRWNDKMKVTLPALQEKKGQEAGSWDPNNDQFGTSGGRLYTTCFCIYCLEVYYRHLSLYDVTPEMTKPSTPADAG